MNIPINPYYTGMENYYKPKPWQKAGNEFKANGVNAGAAGLAGYGQGQQGVNDFTIDSFAGLKGSGQGFASGGVYGAIAGGISAQVGQFSKLNKNLKNLDTNVDLTNDDGSYNSAAYANYSNTLNSLNEGDKKLSKWGVADVFDPATKLFGAAFGSKRKLRNRRNQLMASQHNSQQDYNQQSLANRDQYLQQQDYLDRINPYQREYNVYSTR